MALEGRLEDLAPAEIFQLIALTRKSGKLVVSCEDREGIVVFKNGKIVFAVSDVTRSGIDETLRRGSVVPDAAFLDEVERQGLGSPTDSGGFVVHMGESQRDALTEVVREHIEATVRQLVGWNSGRFVFDTMSLPDSEDLGIDTSWFVLQTGVEPRQLVLTALTKLDEAERNRWQRDIENAKTLRPGAIEVGKVESDISAIFEVLVDKETGEVSWAPRTTPQRSAGRELANLHRLVTEFSGMEGLSPSLTAEVTLLILRFAAQLVSRGVLFAVRSDVFQGVGQFGLSWGSESPESRVRKLEIPRGSPSLLEQVATAGRTYLGPLGKTPLNARIMEALGAGQPAQVVAMPLVVDGSVLAVLYGDNLPDRSVVGTVDGLEILMHEIGLGVAKARLERQLKTIREDRTEDPT